MTLVMIILYYRQILKVNEECEKAEGVVGNITIGFGKKVQKRENAISVVNERVERLASEGEDLLRKMDNHERRLAEITNKAEKKLQSRSKIMTEVEAIEERTRQAASMQETIEQKIDKLKKARSEVATKPKLEIVAPIPIERKRALAHLTEYQLKILEILATEGEKTAPEMKDKIGITREHTARLMKRLCEEGYAERHMGETHHRTYVYRITEEARAILK